jgi:hypothetical protein
VKSSRQEQWQAEPELSAWWWAGPVQIERAESVTTMAVPGTNQVQFNTAGGQFSVDSITDPNGAPSDVIDLDLGFVIRGTATLPNWLQGTGTVTVYAQEIGGPFNGPIGDDNSLKFVRPVPPAEPATANGSSANSVVTLGEG